MSKNRKTNLKMERSFREIVFRWASSLEEGPGTRGHLERISRYCFILAEAVGKPPAWSETFSLAAVLHDVGKTGVAESLRRKTGKFDDADWAEMKKHTFCGEKILGGGKDAFLSMAARIAVSHHEKWDGSGYPAGLKGEGIPLEGRLMALADAFDALTSHRIYKPSFPLPQALHILRGGAGNHFDPAVVDVFFRRLPALLKIMKKFSSPLLPAPSLNGRAPSVPQKPSLF